MPFSATRTDRLGTFRHQRAAEVEKRDDELCDLGGAAEHNVAPVDGEREHIERLAEAVVTFGCWPSGLFDYVGDSACARVPDSRHRRVDARLRARGEELKLGDLVGRRNHCAILATIFATVDGCHTALR